MLLVLLTLSVLTISSARPSDKVNGRNIITVPPNCPPGQEWINGQCRDIWLTFTTPAPALKMFANSLSGKNMITAPPNCRVGQQWINGQCRDIWFKLSEPASALDTNNKDKESDISAINIASQPNIEASMRNVISVPHQCPIGYRPDANGVCRKIFSY